MKRIFRQHGCDSRKGMALLEVMMALFIFTLVAFSLVMALDAAMDAANERNEIDAVMRGLSNQIEQLHAQRVIPGETDVPDDKSGITYHVSIAPEPLQNQKKQPLANFYRATITAKWTFAGQAEDRTVSELVYQP